MEIKFTVGRRTITGVGDEYFVIANGVYTKDEAESLKSQIESKLAQADTERITITSCECNHWEWEHGLFQGDGKRQCKNCKCGDFKPKQVEIRTEQDKLNEQELSQLRPIVKALREEYQSFKDGFSTLEGFCINVEVSPRNTIDEMFKRILATTEDKTK